MNTPKKFGYLLMEWILFAVLCVYVYFQKDNIITPIGIDLNIWWRAAALFIAVLLVMWRRDYLISRDIKDEAFRRANISNPETLKVLE